MSFRKKISWLLIAIFLLFALPTPTLAATSDFWEIHDFTRVYSIAASKSGTLTVTGMAISASGAATFGGAVTCSSTLAVIGTSAFSDNMTLATDKYFYWGTGGLASAQYSAANGLRFTMGSATGMQVYLNSSTSKFNVMNGATQLGTGTSAITQGTGTLYVVGASEFDGAERFDGAATFNSTAEFNGVATHTANVKLNDAVQLVLGTDSDATLAYNNTTSILGLTATTFALTGAQTISSTLGVAGAINANGGIANTDAEALAINANAAQKIILGGTSTGDIDLTRNTNALAGLDVTGALTVSTTSTLTGNVDAQAGLDVTGAVLTTAVGITNTAGEVLISGGNVQLNDAIVFSFGTDDDATVQWNNTTSHLDVVASTVDLTGAFTASGLVTANSLTVTTSVSIGTTLGVTGLTTLTGGAKFLDAGNLTFGTDSDVSVQWNNTNQDLIVDNTSVTGSTVLQLGTDTSATDVIIKNDTGTALLTVDGSGQATFSGNINANSGVDVAGAALTSSAGITNTAGEILVSGGNMQLSDAIVFTFGSDDDASLSWNNTTSHLDVVATTVDLTGAFTASGLVTANSLSVTTSATVGTTLGVTGLSTLGGGVKLDDAVVLTFGTDSDASLSYNNTTAILGLTASTFALTGAQTISSTLGVSGLTTLTGGGLLPDSVSLYFGTDSDASINYNNTTAILGLTATTFALTGSQTISSTLTVTGLSTFDGGAKFADAVVATFGTDSDATISWNNTTSHLDVTAATFDLTGALNTSGLATLSSLSVTTTSSLNGLTTANAGINLVDNVGLIFGSSSDAQVRYEITETVDSLEFGLSADSRRIIFAEVADIGGDTGLAQATTPTITVANTDYNAFAHLTYQDLTFSNGEKIDNSTNDVLSVSSAVKGLQLYVTTTNPQGSIDAQAGCLMICSNAGNQYLFVNAGGVTWWGITLITGTSMGF